jgi:hypothetical protein
MAVLDAALEYHPRSEQLLQAAAAFAAEAGQTELSRRYLERLNAPP